ncbi:MAG: O-antigen ligase family protein [Ruminococcus sp.]|nr:O-antigen ligase family protein [Ruminococcus sp.]
MASKKSTNSNTPRLRLTVRHALADLYVLLMFTFFPIFLSSFYSAARRDKFWVFLLLTGIAGVSVGIISIVDAFSKNSTYNQKLNTYRDPFKISVTDIAFAAFVGISVISSLTSGRLGHCMMGLSESNSGRNMGLITIALLFAGYMVISRFFFFKKYVFYGIFAGITVVSLLAIINYYYMDPLGIFEAYKNSSNYETVLKDFTSTIGNKNYLSAFICVALPFSLGVALTSNNLVMKIIAYTSTGIQFMGLIVATSDGGFLGFLFMLAFLFVMLSRNPKMLSKYFFALAIMGASAKILRLFDVIMKENSKGYSSFSALFLRGPLSYILIVICAALAVIMYFVSKKTQNKLFPKPVMFIVLGIMVLGIVGIIALIVNYTFINTEEALTGFKRFFRFDEYWGTHRGYFWIRTFDVFKDNMNFWQKLFGTGPDTYFYAFKSFFPELSKKFGESSTNSAHNVYLNNLVTHGILGLAAYLTLVISSVVLTVKRAKFNPIALVCLCVIVTYAAQDFVNIANAVNTPLYFIFIALSEATLLKANSSEHLAVEKY